MIVFNSMIVVVALLGIFYSATTSQSLKKENNPVPWIYAILAMGYIVFWAGLRSGYIDTRTYISWFKAAPSGLNEALLLFSTDKNDKGFIFLEIIFKTLISSDFHYWLFFIALITGVPIAIGYRNHSLNFFYSIFLFISSTTCTWMFNGIRQMLAASILFGFGYLIEKRKLYKFIIVLIIASFIHGTAWLMFPVYFFVTDKPFGRRMFIFVLFALSFAVALEPMMDSMETVLQNTQYASNLEQFVEDDGVNPLRVVFSAIPVILAFFKRKTLIRLNNKYMNMCVNMSIFATGFFFVGMFTSGIMIGRIPLYFSLYNYVLLPYLFIKIYPNYKKSLYFLTTLIFCLFYYLLCRHIYYISDVLGNYN